ncbi:CdaR family transcriptional regulator [Pseudonocardia sp. ICBG1293]|uniref:PucR family transcriptional regulator n=1 Tax=Pseudonocardia sp. ICBG1293 TaxID=2844382 RepID=UPI001CCB98AF|nr:helix-turn-helix domain-containing protein [Pseudonocardia sp. ICBG1293]
MAKRARDRLHTAGTEDEAGLQEAVDALAERLQRSVAIDDPNIRLLAASRHFGDEDETRIRSVLGRDVDDEVRELVQAQDVWQLTEPARLTLPLPGVTPRLCVPIRCAGLLLGFLWLIEDAPLTEEQIADSVEVAETIGLRLYRRDVALERRRARMEVLLRGLVSSDTATRGDALSELREDDLLPEADHVEVAVVGRRAAAHADDDAADVDRALATALAQAADQVLRRAPGHSTLVWVRRTGLVVLVAGDQVAGHQVEQVAARVTAELDRATGGGWTAGTGSHDGGLAEARQAYRHAVIANRAAQHLPEFANVVTWEELGVYGLLAMLTPGDLDISSYPAPLLRLAGHRGARLLLETAETFLDLAGDVQRAAAELHIHRATLYQRLSRIEQLTGLSFANGGDRLTFHLGVKIARLAGTYDRLVASPRRPDR